jgi:hypothetical protein
VRLKTRPGWTDKAKPSALLDNPPSAVDDAASPKRSAHGAGAQAAARIRNCRRLDMAALRA